MEKLLFWIDNARYHSLGQSIMPALLAILAAFFSSSFNLFLALTAVVGVILAHLGTNLLDDYFDYVQNKDAIEKNIKNGGKTARFGKCLYLFKEKTTPNELFATAVSFCLSALVFGFLIFLRRGIPIVEIAGIAGLLCFFYSAPPFKLSYRGLGEIITGILFGPLLMNGVYYSACGQFSFGLFLISCCIGLMVANILYVHSILDCNADKEAGKNTLAVILGRKFYFIPFLTFLFLPYALIYVGIIYKLFSPFYFLVFLSIPHAVLLSILMQKDRAEKIPRKWYMMPMERWDIIEKLGIDWFMTKWYLARNLIMFFCILLGAAIICSNYFI